MYITYHDDRGEALNRANQQSRENEMEHEMLQRALGRYGVFLQRNMRVAHTRASMCMQRITQSWKVIILLTKQGSQGVGHAA